MVNKFEELTTNPLIPSLEDVILLAKSMGLKEPYQLWELHEKIMKRWKELKRQ